MDLHVAAERRKTRRAFLSRAVPSLLAVAAAGACSLWRGPDQVALAKAYLKTWADNLESMLGPYNGSFDHPIIAIGEYRSPTYGGEFAALQRVVDLAKPDVVALQGLAHDDTALDDWNQGRFLGGFQMFNYYTYKTEGRRVIRPVPPSRRDQSLERFFDHIRDRVPLAGLDPNEEELNEVLGGPTKGTDSDRMHLTAELRVKNAGDIYRTGRRAVTFTEFVYVGAIAGFLAPLLAMNGSWKRIDAERATRSPALLYEDAEEVPVFLTEPRHYTLKGAYGDAVLPVLGMEPGALQSNTETIVLRLKDAVGQSFLHEEMTLLRRLLVPFMIPGSSLGHAPGQHVVTCIDGGVAGERLQF